MEPFVALMRRYCIDYTNSPRPDRLRRDHGARLRRAHLGLRPAARRRLQAGGDAASSRASPGSARRCTSSSRTATGWPCASASTARPPTRAAASRRGAASASTSGTASSCSRTASSRTSSRRRSSSRRASPRRSRPPHLDPWVTTRAEPANRGRRGTSRARGSRAAICAPPRAWSIDGSWTRRRESPLDVETVEVNDLFSAGARVAFHVTPARPLPRRPARRRRRRGPAARRASLRRARARRRRRGPRRPRDHRPPRDARAGSLRERRDDAARRPRSTCSTPSSTSATRTPPTAGCASTSRSTATSERLWCVTRMDDLRDVERDAAPFVSSRGYRASTCPERDVDDQQGRPRARGAAPARLGPVHPARGRGARGRDPRDRGRRAIERQRPYGGRSRSSTPSPRGSRPRSRPAPRLAGRAWRDVDDWSERLMRVDMTLRDLASR